MAEFVPAGSAGKVSDSSFVADTAIIENGAFLGPGVRIWHHAQVRVGAQVGANTIIGKDCFLDERVIVGERSKIQNGAQIYAPSVIGRGVFIGPHVILTNDRYPRAISPDGEVLNASDWTSIGCVVGEGAAVGARSVVICTTIGSWALVGAGSVVTKPVLSHALVLGNPARQIGWVCYCGVRVEELCAKCGWTTHD